MQIKKIHKKCILRVNIVKRSYIIAKPNFFLDGELYFQYASSPPYITSFYNTNLHKKNSIMPIYGFSITYEKFDICITLINRSFTKNNMRYFKFKINKKEYYSQMLYFTPKTIMKNFLHKRKLSDVLFK